MNIKHWIIWFKKMLAVTLNNQFDVTFISEPQGDLGALEGVQFESEYLGGYVYFWSGGYVGLQLMDYETSVDIVPDSTKEITNDDTLKETLTALLNEITARQYNIT